MLKISPKPNPGRRGFRTFFRHPKNKSQVVCVSLGTQDELEARAICRDMESMFANARVMALKEPDDQVRTSFHPTAVRIVFCEKSEDEFPHLKPSNGDKSRSDNVFLLADADHIRRRLIEHLSTIAKFVPSCPPKKLAAIIGAVEEKRHLRELDENFRIANLKVKVLEPENSELRAENDRLRRLGNVHVKASIRQAFNKFLDEYKDRAGITQAQCKHAVEDFIKSLPRSEGTPLAEIKTQHVDKWVAKMTLEDGKTVAKPVTKKKNRAYLSSFLTWCYKRYNLAENPMAKASSVHGYARHAEQIVAISRLEEINALIDGLEKWPYWQAWVAVAMLTGLRWSEQVFLRKEDVHLDDGYLRVCNHDAHKVKTGRERNVPIEKTKLLPILQKFMAKRSRSQWLFPSLVSNGPRPRTRTAAGAWASCSWLQEWKLVSRRAKNKTKIKGDFWKYTQKVWRHSYGTTLGMCGWNSLEISRVMGNSPAIAERHYVAVASTGVHNRWPFQW